MQTRNKKLVVVITLLFIASLFIIGADWANEKIHRLYHSYFADIALPFGFYMLLVLVEDDCKPVRNGYVKAALVFALCSLSEILQYFGIYALASVFDPVDFIMYASGVLLASFTDRIVYKNLFVFWH